MFSLSKSSGGTKFTVYPSFCILKSLCFNYCCRVTSSFPTLTVLCSNAKAASIGDSFASSPKFPDSSFTLVPRIFCSYSFDIYLSLNENSWCLITLRSSFCSTMIRRESIQVISSSLLWTSSNCSSYKFYCCSKRTSLRIAKTLACLARFSAKSESKVLSFLDKNRRTTSLSIL